VPATLLVEGPPETRERLARKVAAFRDLMIESIKKDAFD
jgi:hypothetical protein